MEGQSGALNTLNGASFKSRELKVSAKRANVAGFGGDSGKGKGKGKGKGSSGKGGKGGASGSLFGGGVRGLVETGYDPSLLSVDSGLPTTNNTPAPFLANKAAHEYGAASNGWPTNKPATATVKPEKKAASATATRRASEVLSKHSVSKAATEAGSVSVVAKKPRLADRLGDTKSSKQASGTASNAKTLTSALNEAALKKKLQQKQPAAVAAAAPAVAASPASSGGKGNKKAAAAVQLNARLSGAAATAAPATAAAQRQPAKKKEEVKVEEVKVLSFAEILAAKRKKQEEAANASPATVNSSASSSPLSSTANNAPGQPRARLPKAEEEGKVEEVKVLSFAEILAAKRKKQEEAANASPATVNSSASSSPLSSTANKRSRPTPGASAQGGGSTGGGGDEDEVNNSAATKLPELSVEALEANLEAALADTPRNDNEAAQGEIESAPDAGEGDAASNTELVLGDRIIAQFGGGEEWYNGVVSAVHEDDGSFDVAYDDGDKEERKPRSQLAPAPPLEES
eukprot:CAMPEP_0171983684 /NCGR_PEP_ID=MMETSP0993-20121228/273428_1 /TAXON_ID=483369 /ORGANISM="non described non described, Strain CCMP2098" /LENGTH=515 /DNA_ID=CAMNT_0012636467 /DNA_START=750 /DNA_END=2298 /DNA_ORIENTATION=-